MNKAYKYKLLPNQQQIQLLQQIAGNSRWLWNYMLAQQQTKYDQDKKFVFAIEMANQLPALKKTNNWLSLSPSQSLQQTCIDQDIALKSVWKSGFGFPKFKSKHKSRDSFRIPQSNSKTPHIKVSSSHITIPKIGLIKWCYHRPVEGKIKSITISRDIEDWYVSILVEIPDVVPIPIKVSTSKSIGIDLGITHFLIDSNGNKVASPKYLKQKLRKLKHYNRIHAKKTNGSKNKAKSRNRLARVHREIRCSRKDFLDKLSNQIVKTYDIICLEDLKIKNLMKGKNKSLNRAISDQGWGMFTSLLAQKARRDGKTITKINTYAPSSKTCSCCGYKMNKMSLDIRNWCCPSCNTEHDRDINAANNILFWGLLQTKNTEGTSEINACGDTSTQNVVAYDTILEVSEKQEACGSLVRR